MWRRVGALAVLHGVGSSVGWSEPSSDNSARLAILESRVAALEATRRRASSSVESSWAAPKLEPEALYSEADLAVMVSTLAADISKAYAGLDEELIVVGLLDGVFIFVADLSRQITVPHAVDFVSASSYGANTVSSGNVKIKKDAGASVRGKHVLLVDEICDSGRTLASLHKLFAGRETASVKTCVLLDKTSRRVVDIQPDFVGAVCPDKFVIGYGMDYGGKYRSLPFVGVLKREASE